MIDLVITVIGCAAIIVDAILTFRASWTLRIAYTMLLVGALYAVASYAFAIYGMIPPSTAALTWLPVAVAQHGRATVYMRSRNATQLLAERVMADNVRREIAEQRGGSNVRVLKGLPPRGAHN